uniref:VHS domain-containing protein n=1 Tax=Strongyloides stercoralis TaxID=6248 RepID=A0A0K0E5T1_STRER
MENSFVNISDEGIFNKPIEYYVALSINPYSIEEERKGYWNVLCQRILKDVEGPQIVTKCFSHKIISPDHNEASITIDVIEYCLRICGYRLAIDLGKYKFLNSIIKLLSPKYLGNETPKEIKDKVIVLLYGWQKYLGHIGKFKEVYTLLKKQNLILNDPKVNIDEYVIECKKPVKMACFEDEEKSKLLASLLASKKEEDLEAANRLIKCLVKSEEKKTERKIKKIKEVDKVKDYICILYKLLNNFSANTTTIEECKTIEELYNKILKFQPIIQNYANETEDNEDDFLKTILDVNDDILRILEMYDKIYKYNNDKKNDINNHNKIENYIKHVSWSDESEGSSLETIVNDDEDMLSIWSRQNTPQIKKKIMKPVPILNTTSNDNTNSDDDDTIFHSKVEFNKNFNLLCNDLQDLEFPSQPKVEKVEFIIKEDENDSGLFLDNFSLTPNDLDIDSKDPLTIFDLHNLKIILYYTKPKKKLFNKNIITTFVTITNFNTHLISDVNFNLQSRVKLVNFKLEKTSQKELQSFNPLSSVNSINQLLYILPLSDNINECEFQFQLSFTSKNNMFQEFGQFLLKLK